MSLQATVTCFAQEVKQTLAQLRHRERRAHPMVATLNALKTYREPKMSEAGASAANSTLVANCDSQRANSLQGITELCQLLSSIMELCWSRRRPGCQDVWVR